MRIVYWILTAWAVLGIIPTLVLYKLKQDELAEKVFASQLIALCFSNMLEQ